MSCAAWSRLSQPLKGIQERRRCKHLVDLTLKRHMEVTKQSDSGSLQVVPLLKNKTIGGLGMYVVYDFNVGISRDGGYFPGPLE